MLKHFLEWANQDISSCDFIGLAFVSCLIAIGLLHPAAVMGSIGLRDRRKNA
jgi:hypothetical protein